MVTSKRLSSKVMGISGFLFSTAFIVVTAMAQEAPKFSKTEVLEATCRVEAKKAATETYRSCVAEKKSAQLETLKKAYDQRIADLQRQYEQELQLLGKKTDSKTPKSTKIKSAVSERKKIEINASDLESSADGALDIPEPISSGN